MTNIPLIIGQKSLIEHSRELDEKLTVRFFVRPFVTCRIYTYNRSGYVSSSGFHEDLWGRL